MSAHTWNTRKNPPLWKEGQTALFENEQEENGGGESENEVPEVDHTLLQRHKRSFKTGAIEIYHADAMACYDDWESPVTIVSDGPYGVSGFPGDAPTHERLSEWYEPHIRKWSEKATGLTSLWFWNTEIGWAVVHPIFEKYHWTYRGCSIWDKGIAHIAGNSNTKTLRRVQATTEVCVHYTKEVDFPVNGKILSMKEWLRYEWKRSGIPLRKTNEACGVIDAATRKYFTQCHLWYFPPVEAFEDLVKYANRYGEPNGRPYFSLDGVKPLTGDEWSNMRARFSSELGLTNVWREPAVRGVERLKNGNKSIHMNQKPLRLVELILRLTTNEGDIVWDPFAGLCTVAVGCHKLRRHCRCAEISENFYQLGVSRFARYIKTHRL